MNEAVVSVGAHEVFHFLLHSLQIGGRDGENEADHFVRGQLDQCRRAGHRNGAITGGNLKFHKYRWRSRRNPVVVMRRDCAE